MEPRRRGCHASDMTFHAPHESVDLDVTGGHISHDDWQLLCGKLGFVEASYVLSGSGIEITQRGERAKGFAARLIDRFRSSGLHASF